MHRKLRDEIPASFPLVGRFFRRFSFDELPQLWTRGSRRHEPRRRGRSLDDHLKQFDLPFLELRQRVRPGYHRPLADRHPKRRHDQRTEDVRYLLHPQLVSLAGHLSARPDGWRGAQRPRGVPSGRLLPKSLYASAEAISWPCRARNNPATAIPRTANRAVVKRKRVCFGRAVPEGGLGGTALTSGIERAYQVIGIRMRYLTGRPFF